MARKARVKSTSGIYHVLVTGEKSNAIFNEPSDLRKFIELLGEYSDVCGFKLYAYCLMENHAHLLINENGADISRIMKRIGTSYVYWFNNKYDRQGQLFADRFKSEPIETEEEFKRALKFIHLNPVESGDAVSASSYMYSSYFDYFSNEHISSDMARRVFGGKQDFIEYHSGKAEKCLEISRSENVLTDEALSAVLERDYFLTAETAQNLSRERQSEIYSAVTKKYNVPLRQLSRVTKINLSKLWRLIAE